MNKKIIYVLVLVLVVSLGAFYLGTLHEVSPQVAKVETSLAREKPQEEDLGYVYETDADSAEDCTSYENFDAKKSVCYFECSSDKECADIQKSVDAEIDSWADDTTVTNAKSENSISSKDPSLVAEYKVSPGEKITLTKGKMGDKDAEIWKTVSLLSPDELSDKYIDTFQVFNNKNDDTLAFVDDENQDDKWRVAINLAGYESSDTKERNLTVVHELGHIVTLNASQFESSDKNCKTYETDEGCTLVNSYLNNFVKKFWSSADINKSKSENADLYEENKFITEYAASSPEEDLAESFAYFVIDNKSEANEVKDQKLNFFYSFPALEDIRTEMRTGLSSNIIRARKMAQ